MFGDILAPRMSPPVSGLLRIGEFSRRVGVPVPVLRAWERRYGLFAPSRTPGGYRLYGEQDERRARRMLAHVGKGIAPAESARLVLAAGDAQGEPEALTALAQAWEALDVAGAHRALDALLDGPAPEVVVCGSVLPLLERLTEGWDADPYAEGHAHVAHRTLETRLLATAAAWHQAAGPLALIACGPDEHRASAPIACGLALHRRGWRIAYLGSRTPLAAIEAAARALRPDRVLVFSRGPVDVRRLAEEVPVFVMGAAETPGVIALRGAPLDWALTIAY
jgi:DNA-binding transcriptional MerR regulator